MTEIEHEYLDSLCIDADMCTNCCIAEGMDVPHDDCAGPEGYACDCYCREIHPAEQTNDRRL